mgnify:CR=1 FL=1
MFFSEDLSELKIQLESASETERDLKALLEHNEGKDSVMKLNYNSLVTYI